MKEIQLNVETIITEATWLYQGEISGPALEFLLETTKKSAHAFKSHGRAEDEKQHSKVLGTSLLHPMPTAHDPPALTREYKHRPAETQHTVSFTQNCPPTNPYPKFSLFTSIEGIFFLCKNIWLCNKNHRENGIHCAANFAET